MTPEVSQADATTQTWVRVFRASLRGLRALYDPSSGLMAQRGERMGDGWRLHAPSARNTAMVLGALYRLDALGIAHGLDARALAQRLDDLGDTMSVPDTCLDLWSDAVGEGRRSRAIWERLKSRLDTGALEALELAWALSALSHHFPQSSRRDEVAAVAAGVATRLVAHQHEATGMFRASLRRHGLLRRRARVAALASQIYPTYALVKFAEAFDRADALRAARRCADTLLPLQGAQGQWWKHYDVVSARVTGEYPVYPVNQDAAVPIALLSLARHGGAAPLVEAVARGLAWERGENEVGTPLIDDHAGSIARSVDRTGGGWQVSWDWYSYHPARAISAVVEVGEILGLDGPSLATAAFREPDSRGA